MTEAGHEATRSPIEAGLREQSPPPIPGPAPDPRGGPAPPRGLRGGGPTAESARPFLVPGATIAQRIVRAKRTLTARRVPFELPPRAEIPGRLTSVLEVIYLMFNEGYSATGGSDWMRPE